MNTYGLAFRVSTFGESHGKAIGCLIDGMPSGVKIDEEYIQKYLNRRKTAQNKFSTQRKENDEFEILSGVFEGYSTGTPIMLVIFNQNQKSKDYENIKDLFRPSHADFTYFYKYGIRDYRGGGRASARETAARVAAGAFANLVLLNLGIKIQSGVFSVGDIQAQDIDFDFAKNSEIYALDKNKEEEQKQEIQKAMSNHDSVGASVLLNIKGLLVGLGEPLYYKLDSELARVLMGINGVKAVEIGDGVKLSQLKASMANDFMDKNGFLTNHSGGIQGGISNGEEVLIKVHFKPTPSIFQAQKTLDKNNKEVICELRGRHDPCIGIRGSVVTEAMAACVIFDMLKLNLGCKISDFKKIYTNN